MKRVNYLVSYYLLISILVLCTGCSKIIEHFRHHDDPDQVNCRITRVTAHDPANPDSLLVFNFDYDDVGNPIAIHTADTRYFNYQLRYNGSHQLTDLIELNQDSQYLTWHRYRYNGNLIVQDTFHQTNGGRLLISASMLSVRTGIPYWE